MNTCICDLTIPSYCYYSRLAELSPCGTSKTKLLWWRWVLLCKQILNYGIDGWGCNRWGKRLFSAHPRAVCVYTNSFQDTVWNLIGFIIALSIQWTLQQHPHIPNIFLCPFWNCHLLLFSLELPRSFTYRQFQNLYTSNSILWTSSMVYLQFGHLTCSLRSCNSNVHRQVQIRPPLNLHSPYRIQSTPSTHFHKFNFNTNHLRLGPGQRSRYSDWLWARRPRGTSSSPVWVKNFHFSMPSRPTLGPTQDLCNGYRGSFLGVKATWAWSWPLTN
jgi:hypothetical protein